MEQLQILQLTLDDFRELLSDVVNEGLNQMERDSPEQLLTINETCSRLNISKPTLNKYSDNGILTRHKIGERVYYRWSDILSAMKKIEPSISKAS